MNCCEQQKLGNVNQVLSPEDLKITREVKRRHKFNHKFLLKKKKTHIFLKLISVMIFRGSYSSVLNICSLAQL